MPGTNKRLHVSAVKNTYLKPSCHRAGTTTTHSPHQTQPDVCPRNGPGLPAHPTQSRGQPSHPSLFPYIGMKRPTRRQNPEPEQVRISQKETCLSPCLSPALQPCQLSTWSRPAHMKVHKLTITFILLWFSCTGKARQKYY